MSMVMDAVVAKAMVGGNGCAEAIRGMSNGRGDGCNKGSSIGINGSEGNGSSNCRGKGNGIGDGCSESNYNCVIRGNSSSGGNGFGGGRGNHSSCSCSGSAAAAAAVGAAAVAAAMAMATVEEGGGNDGNL